jgi:hypothetical protein
MVPNKTTDLDATMYEKQDENREIHPTADNDDEKRDLEKLHTSEAADDAAENQEYYVTAKTWLVVWVNS